MVNVFLTLFCQSEWIWSWLRDMLHAAGEVLRAFSKRVNWEESRQHLPLTVKIMKTYLEKATLLASLPLLLADKCMYPQCLLMLLLFPLSFANSQAFLKELKICECRNLLGLWHQIWAEEAFSFANWAGIRFSASLECRQPGLNYPSSAV